MSHGCQPEHPLNMGEDSKQCVVCVHIFTDRMASRIVQGWTSWMPADSGLDDHNDCSQNWNVVTRALGYEIGVCFAMSSSSMLDHHLL